MTRSAVVVVPAPRGAPRREALDPWRTFAHAFGSDDRVLGFGGVLGGAGVELSLETLVVACSTLRTDVPPGFERSVAHSCERNGWRPAGSEASFERDAFELALVAGEGAGAALHLVLTAGVARESLFKRLFGMISGLLDVLPEPSPDERVSAWAPVAPVSPVLVTCERLASALRCRRVLALTGAGLSASAGIATFTGSGSLDDVLGLSEPYPGTIVDSMIECPRRLAGALCRFQSSFVLARPTPAHHALAGLQRAGALAGIVTRNFDHLHEQAGSTHVVRAADRTRWPSPANLAFLLVVGVSRDEGALVAYYRRHGARVVVVDPLPPPFLRAGDWYLAGSAESVVPELATRLLA